MVGTLMRLLPAFLWDFLAKGGPKKIRKMMALDRAPAACGAATGPLVSRLSSGPCRRTGDCAVPLLALGRDRRDAGRFAPFGTQARLRRCLSMRVEKKMKSAAFSG